MKNKPMHSSYGIPRGTIPFTPGEPHVEEYVWFVPQVRCGDEVIEFAAQKSEENARAVAEYEIRVTRQTTVDKRDKAGWVWYPNGKREEFLKIQQTQNPIVSIRSFCTYEAIIFAPGYGLVSDPSPKTKEDAERIVRENLATFKR